MAYLLDVVRNGILSSHELSETCHAEIYDGSALPQINPKALSSVILDRLRVMDCGVNEIIVNKYSRFPTANICGILLLNRGVATIYVNSNRTECWQRFTVCKELLQLYIDCTKAPSAASIYTGSDIVKQIEDLVETQDKLKTATLATTGFHGSLDPFSDKVSSEMEAIATAIDLVFPKKLKKQIISDVPIFVASGGYKWLDIAEIVKMPEYVVNTYYRSFHNISIDLIPPDTRA
ncbi:MAG TPA: hypothetical protein VNW06_05495 [Cytophagaceae bacterium]|jgi:hypothetical protein|nr:hypothetical protein [Cytophagaceae bacterium]